MIAVLLAGRLLTAPQEYENQSGTFTVKVKLKAALGREAAETWTLLAYAPAVRKEIMKLGAGAHLAVSGVPKTEITLQRRGANTEGETVIARTLFVDRVLSLVLPEGGSADE
jgi:hypothetical protein